MRDNTTRLLAKLLVLGTLFTGSAPGAELDGTAPDSVDIRALGAGGSGIQNIDAGNISSAETESYPQSTQEPAAIETQPATTRITETDSHTGSTPVNLDSFLDAIKSEQALGSYNPALSESFYSLGLALQQNEQHQAALDSLRRALHIIRVNNGIYSLAQSPVLRAIIDSHRALNRVEDTTADYHHLLWLHLKTFGDNDPRLIPVLNELSHWHLHAYSLASSSSEFDHLTTSHALNSAAMRLAESAPYTTRVELLRTCALTSFFLSTHQGDDWRSASDSRFRFSTEPLNAGLPSRGEVLTGSGYRNGRVAYEEIIAVLEREPAATAEEKIRAYTELGDWYLLFNRRDTALATYAQALTLANRITGPEQISDQFFTSPHLLPAIWAEPESAGVEKSYVEARLDVSKTGAPSNVEIVASQPQNDLTLRRTVASRLKKARFRPRFVDGVATDTQGMLIKIPGAN